MLLFFEQKDLHQEPLKQFAVAFQVRPPVVYPNNLLGTDINDCRNSEYRITELFLYNRE